MRNHKGLVVAFVVVYSTVVVFTLWILLEVWQSGEVPAITSAVGVIASSLMGTVLPWAIDGIVNRGRDDDLAEQRRLVEAQRAQADRLEEAMDRMSDQLEASRHEISRLAMENTALRLEADELATTPSSPPETVAPEFLDRPATVPSFVDVGSTGGGAGAVTVEAVGSAAVGVTIGASVVAATLVVVVGVVPFLVERTVALVVAGCAVAFVASLVVNTAAARSRAVARRRSGLDQLDEHRGRSRLPGGDGANGNRPDAS